MGLNINLNRGSMNTATFAASRYHLIANVIVLITNHWRKYISKSLQNIPTPDEMYAFMITVKLCVWVRWIWYQQKHKLFFYVCTQAGIVGH